MAATCDSPTGHFGSRRTLAMQTNSKWYYNDIMGYIYL